MQTINNGDTGAQAAQKILANDQENVNKISAAKSDNSRTFVKGVQVAGSQLFDRDIPDGNKNAGMLATGVIESVTSTSISLPIKVKPNTTYRFRSAAINTGAKYTTAFNAKMEVLPSEGSAAYATTFTTGANTAYIILTIANSGISDFMVNEGSTVLPWAAFPPVVLAESAVPDVFRKKADKITQDDLSFATPSQNLLNWKAPGVTSNRFINWSTGALATPSGGAAEYTATDFIRIPDDVKQITTSRTHQMAFYTSNAVSGYIPAASDLAIPYGQVKTFDVPSGAKYYRQGFQSNLLDGQMISPGPTLPTSYVAPGYTLRDVKLETPAAVKEDLLLLDIKEICVAVGRTVEIYNSQVAWCGNVDNFHFFWTGVGKGLKRKVQITGTTATIGSYTLTLQVYDNNMSLIASKTYPVKIVAATVPVRSLCAIGDSLTNFKPWMQEIRNLTGNDISFVGTRWGQGASTNGIRHEGRSGASSNYYIGNNSYTFDSNGIAGTDGRPQNLNPFWNPNTNAIDFNYYKSNYGMNPDFLMIWLGTNGIALDPTTNASRIITFLNGLKNSGASALPIFIVHTLYRGDQNGIGRQSGTDGFTAIPAWKLQEDRKVFNLHNEIYRLAKDIENVFLIPISAEHDSEYNFTPANDATPVNPRAWQTEPMASEATHPQNAGYMQIADAMYSSFAANLK